VLHARRLELKAREQALWEFATTVLCWCATSTAPKNTRAAIAIPGKVCAVFHPELRQNKGV